MSLIKVSKLTEKYQATIPSEVREILKLKKGGRIAFEIQSNKTILLRKAVSSEYEWTKSLENTLSEWTSEKDEEAYSDL
jgi:antitoxin PrlF